MLGCRPWTLRSVSYSAAIMFRILVCTAFSDPFHLVDRLRKMNAKAQQIRRRALRAATLLTF